MKMYEGAVTEFIDKYGQYRSSNPKLCPLVVAMLRVRLMVEEMGELAEAMDKGNILGIADGLGDLLYVVSGTSVTYGLACNVPHNLKRHLDAGIAFRSLVTNMGRLVCAIQEEKLAQISENIGLIGWDLMEISRVYDLPLYEIFFEIHRSNMTKALPEEGIKQGSKYGKKLGRGGKGPSYEPPNLAPLLRLKHATQ
jgi:predicted HAD superfamily Cof-like phosphohydrolase